MKVTFNQPVPRLVLPWALKPKKELVTDPASLDQTARWSKDPFFRDVGDELLAAAGLDPRYFRGNGVTAEYIGDGQAPSGVAVIKKGDTFEVPDAFAAKLQEVGWVGDPLGAHEAIFDRDTGKVTRVPV